MKLTKRQMVILGVAAVGVVVLVADRMSTEEPASGPAPAQAAARPKRSARPAQAATDPAQETRTPPPAGSVAQRITVQMAQARLDIATVPDALRPSRKWLAELVPANVVVDDPQQPVAPVPKVRPRLSEAFFRTHSLEAVMVSDDRRFAVVNGRCVAVGARIDGFTLMEVQTQSAVFQGPDETVTLPLKTGTRIEP